ETMHKEQRLAVWIAEELVMNLTPVDFNKRTGRAIASSETLRCVERAIRTLRPEGYTSHQQQQENQRHPPNGA
ncbi:MAG: hypothetical protein WAU00_17680, partial [Caldilinea sp.]